jgi:hypothetical protein
MIGGPYASVPPVPSPASSKITGLPVPAHRKDTSSPPSEIATRPDLSLVVDALALGSSA